MTHAVSARRNPSPTRFAFLEYFTKIRDIGPSLHFASTRSYVPEMRMFHDRLLQQLLQIIMPLVSNTLPFDATGMLN